MNTQKQKKWLIDATAIVQVCSVIQEKNRKGGQIENGQTPRNMIYFDFRTGTINQI